MLRVGITGGIGSGKTTVCKIFETLGIPIYYADDRAKYLMEHDPTLIQAIKNTFGSGAYNGETLNRPYLAEKVFHNKTELAKLNALVHPAVAFDAEQWANVQHGVPYTLKEAALLFEAGSYKQLDKLIVVTAPEEVRTERVMLRDNVTAEAVKARMANQWPESDKVALADFIINNDGQHSLIDQVLNVHKALIAAASA